ncbi:MAG: hypothetical protein RL196_1538 [Actinomycetota bacterium]
MSGTWVGFQTSPKPILGAKKREVGLSLTATSGLVELFELLTTPAGLSLWLGQTNKCVPAVGAKFESGLAGEEAQNLFISISVPRQVVILNSLLGEINVKVKNTHGKISLDAKITAAITEADFEAWQVRADDVLAQLESVALNG